MRSRSSCNASPAFATPPGKSPPRISSKNSGSARFRAWRGSEQCSPPAVIIANNHAVNDMPADQNKRRYRIDFLVAAALVTTGLVMSGLSLTELGARGPQQRDPQQLA